MQTILQKCKTPYGEIFVPKNDYIGKLFLNGSHYEEGMAKLLIKLCQNKRTAIDVGANLGSHAIMYMHYFKKVICFEAQKRIADILKMNVKNNVEVYKVALAHKAGECYMSTSTTNSGAAGISKQGEKCEMATLDSYNFQDVDLLKIDTEGSERNILAGAKQTIRRCKPVIMFEYHGEDAFARLMPELYLEVASFQVLPFLLDNGYTKFTKHGKNIVCQQN